MSSTDLSSKTGEHIMSTFFFGWTCPVPMFLRLELTFPAKTLRHPSSSLIYNPRTQTRFPSGTSLLKLHVHNVSTLALHHPVDAYVRNIRGYLSPILQALNCRMDVQSTNGRNMLLRYVTSYVTKSNDTHLMDIQFSSYVLPYIAAFRHLSHVIQYLR